MKALYMVLVALCLAPSVVVGQGAEEWRTRFAAGEQARQAGEVATYATEMAAAVSAMPAGHLNRPLIQYHAARAAALAGRPDEAVQWLRQAWDEDIESLMISFAPFDPAFESLRESSAFDEVMALAGDMELAVRPLGGDMHLIQGTGANVVASLGPDGVFLVDTGYGPALPALRRTLSALGAVGVDLLLVTHPHEDHMGSTPELGSDATVLAHPATTAQMREPYVFMEGVSMPPKPATALADIEISRDTTFVFNGQEIVVVPTEAHTPGDLSVYFTRSRVAHFGDIYLAGNPMMYPGTEDPDGFLDRLDAFLASMDPETVVVGGHEEPADLAAVREQIAQSRACMTFVRESIVEGLTIEETAQRGLGRFPAQWVAFFHQLFTRAGA